MTTVIDLRFSAARSADPSDALELRFGAGAVAPPPPPPPPPPPAPAQLRVVAAARWRGTQALAAATVAARWRGPAASSLGSGWRTWWGASQPVAAAWRSSWGVTDAVSGAWRSSWSGAIELRISARAFWQSTVPLGRQWSVSWRGAQPVRAAAWAAWRGAEPAGATHRAFWRGGMPLVAWAGQVTRLGVPMRAAAVASWRGGVPLVSVGGAWQRPTVPPPPPPICRVDDPSDDLALQFTRPAGLATGPALLRFACWRPAVIVVPVRRVYVVMVSGSLVRVPDGAVIRVLSMRLELDADSWTWGFSAAVRPSAAPLVRRGPSGDPVVLEATMAGDSVRVVVEGISRTRVFGEDALRITGRGISALLAEPYQRVMTWQEPAARTSQQLLDQLLPSGWTADYGLTPWLVPGGVWSHQGTPMSAARAIAAAGGGYVQPHRTAQQLRILPRYAHKPWELSTVTPDLQLPSSAVQREAVEWLDRPAYNAVYVSGTSAGGILVGAKRLGTAGDIEAPMVVDPLITHADAGRQRALPVLADTGQQELVSLRTRVMPGLGIYTPGMIVRYVDDSVTRTGILRGVAADYGGGTDLWQTIKVETHV